MTWLKWFYHKYEAIIILVGILLGLFIAYTAISSAVENYNLKKEAKRFEEERKIQAVKIDETNKKIEQLLDTSQRLASAAQDRDNTISNLSRQLESERQRRLQNETLYRQQVQVIQAQRQQVDVGDSTFLVRTLSDETKTPVDSYSILADRVQIGNETLRSITQKIVDCKIVSSKLTLVTSNLGSCEVDKQQLSISVNDLSIQVTKLIESQKEQNEKVKAQVAELNLAHENIRKVDKEQIDGLTKSLKKERSFFGNLKRSGEKVGLGVLIGIGVAVLAF